MPLTRVLRVSSTLLRGRRTAVVIALGIAMAVSCRKAIEHESPAPQSSGVSNEHVATIDAAPGNVDGGGSKQPAETGDAAPSTTHPWRKLALRCPADREVKTKWYSVGGDTWCETPQGVRDGPYASWWDDAHPNEAGAYRDGKKQGTWSVYHPEGGLWSRGKYVAGLREGQWTWWWSPLFARNQKQEQGSFRAGRPVGRWLSWDEHGKPLSRIDVPRTLRDLGERLERYVNGGMDEDFQTALNVFRRLPDAERKRLAKNRAVEKKIEEAVATDGAGITRTEAEELRAALR